MSKKRNRFDFESEESKTKCINGIIGFFQNERNEEIGYIAAETILDFFLQTMGEEIYKNTIKDCKKLIKGSFDDLEVELDMMSSNK